MSIEIIEANKSLTPTIATARAYSKKLNALVNGVDFSELLIRIEGIETEKKAKARRKYSRSIVDFYARMLEPTSNIYSATGGVKNYDLTDTQKRKLIKHLTNIRGDKSLEKWLASVWMPLYHTDPNGIIFMEYTEKKCYPTYKSIGSIRRYEAHGQSVEWVLFEPVNKTGGVREWRYVDDKVDAIYHEQGNTITLVDEKKHPFNGCPAIVISDIKKIDSELRETTIDAIIELSEEYLRDQSIKTLYKFMHGFPIHWRYVMQCGECSGVGKVGSAKCPNCDGLGYIMKNDVTDVVALPIPDKDGVQLAPNIAGYISPDLLTWNKYQEEIDKLWEVAYATHWGAVVSKQTNETATGRYIDVQPVINKLNMYSDVAEYMEWRISEFVCNWMFGTKDYVCSVSYGRSFIIDSPENIIERYNQAKKDGLSVVILDRLMVEYITAKYKNDIAQLGDMLLKFSIEPYPHYTVEQVNSIFGQIEAQKKYLFSKFWIDADKTKTKEQIENEFINYINKNQQQWKE